MEADRMIMPVNAVCTCMGTEGGTHLSGKVHDCIDFVLSQEMADQVCALNVSLHQLRSSFTPFRSRRRNTGKLTTVAIYKRTVSK